MDRRWKRNSFSLVTTSDNRDASDNLLRHFYGCLMPRACYGKRTEDVGAGQLGVSVLLCAALCAAAPGVTAVLLT